MLWTISRRVIASLVGFLVGWGVFQFTMPPARICGAGRVTPVLVSRRAPEILTITLKRQGCSDAELGCPVYDVTFRQNGTGTFVGYKNNEDYDGKFETSFDRRDFTFLAEQFEKHRFFELSQEYPAVPEQETVVLEVLTSEGLRVVTTHNWATTPDGLRVLQALLDLQGYQVVWADAE